MKKATKLLVGTAAVSAFAAATTYAAGQALYTFALTRKGNKFANDKFIRKSKAAEEHFVPDDLYAESKKWYDETPSEEVNASNSLGDTTHGRCFMQPEHSDKWAIICHGYSGDPCGMARYSRAYYDKGFNILMPYMRGNAKSCSDNISMGWLDRLDLVGWVEYIVDINDDAKIVMHGESMGAASVMMAVGEILPDNVVCAVEDCGYTSVWDEFSYQLPNMFKLPVFPFIHSAQYVTSKHTELDFKRASCVDQLRKSKTPMLFIHGEEDDFVPFFMVFQNYDAFQGEKELYTVPGAKHARSVNVAGEKYWERVWGFVGKYVDVDTVAVNA